MSIFLDKLFVDRIRFQLDKFEWQRSEVANFRCPLCGDSARNQNKKRGYFFPDHTHDCLIFKCHNCDEQSGWSFQFWLMKFNPEVYREYQLELFKETGSGNNLSRKEEAALICAPKGTTTKRIMGVSKSAEILPRSVLEHSIRLRDLPDTHFAKEYILRRKLPEFVLDLFTFTENYRDFIQGIGIQDEELIQKAPHDARIIIPLLSETKQLMGCQGRALDKDAFLRYATNKLDENYPKTFGMERLDRTKTILVVEGPIDSCILPNCVATADSNLLKFDCDGIYIPDNQYRNESICKVIEKIIDSGKRICLFPPTVHAKDINDMVVDYSMSRKDIVGIVAQNTFQGLKAKMRWAELKKV